MSRRKRKPVKRLIIQSDSSEEDDDDDDFVPVTKKFIKSEKLSTNEKRLKRLVPFDDENTATQDNSTCSTATDNSLNEKDSPIKKDTDSSLITDKKEPNPPLPKKQQKPLVTIPPNKDSKTNQNKPLPQPKPYWKPPGAANGKSSTCGSSSSLGPCVRVGLSRKANIKPLHSLK